MKVTWRRFQRLVDALAQKVIDRGDKYEGIYGIARGGLIPAVVLSHKLKLPFITNLNSMYSKQFLVVDDISDTGETLRRVMRTDVFKYAKTATLHYHKQSIVEPDFWVEEKDKDWIVYPWESE